MIHDRDDCFRTSSQQATWSHQFNPIAVDRNGNTDRNYWLFQANPKYSEIVAAIAQRSQIHWLVTRYHNAIAIGDAVLIWVAGKNAGIYATAQVVAAPHFLAAPPDIEIWTLPLRAQARFYAPVALTQKFSQPLLKTNLRHDPVLRSLEVMRAPRNTNFRITPEQWTKAAVSGEVAQILG